MKHNPMPARHTTEPVRLFRGWKKFMDDFYPRFRGWNANVYRSRITDHEPREHASQKLGMQRWINKGYPVMGSGVFSRRS